MSSTSERPGNAGSLAFQVQPRLLTLLGDQLIRDASVAVFELVKNAYDADASRCDVAILNLDSPDDSQIVVEDDGSGMSEAILRDVWMVIGTDHRARQREERTRTPRYNRFPLGEKGLGRLSMHKLGREILLITRQEGSSEYVMELDLEAFEESRDLSEARVRLTRRAPSVFGGDGHGTRLEIANLREPWSRGAIRKLHRAVNSLCSPFEGPGEFEVNLRVPEHDDWLRDLFTAEQARDCALYEINGQLEGRQASFTYHFRPPARMRDRVEPRSVRREEFELEGRDGRKSFAIDLSAHRIGPVDFNFLLFDRDPSVLRSVTDDLKGLKDYLNENGGVRIYRDGIRIYDFGEPGNDWLNLDLRRVNTPTARTSNNQVLGTLELDATLSEDLREKTNREGFIENEAFADFRAAVVAVLTQIEAAKFKDQRRLRELEGRGTGRRIFSQFGELRETLERKGMLSEVEPQLRSLERELEVYREQLLHAAVPGLTIGMMLHDAEKIVDELLVAVRGEIEAERVKRLVNGLYRAMRPISALLKEPATAILSAQTVIEEAVFSTELRLRRHDIRRVRGSEDRDFKIRGSRQMLIASVTNLIDNSIHWLEVRRPTEKLLFVGVAQGDQGRPMIVVCDNGSGFGEDDPEDLVAPFFTRRSGGMGLGLYIVDEVMRSHNGQLLFPNVKDLDVPSGLDGAAVGLQFPEVS